MSNHAIVHIEIPASAPKAAGQFYGDLFGWKTDTDDQFDYTTFRPEDGPGGGFPKVNNEQVRPGAVLLYVDVDDIEASLAKAEKLGGQTVQSRTEIPGMGWFALFSDPTGNVIGLWQTAPQG